MPKSRLSVERDNPGTRRSSSSKTAPGKVSGRYVSSAAPAAKRTAPKKAVLIDSYGAMLARFEPQVIHSRKEYDRLEGIFEMLLDKETRRSRDEDKLFDLLANLLEDYEKRTLPPIPAAAPAELLRLLMESNNLRQVDLAEIFGGQSVVSEVLNGKREITKQQAKQLAERFKVRVDAFI